jgi:hypothetical protein
VNRTDADSPLLPLILTPVDQYWDRTARGLDLESVELSSRVLIAGSIIVSVGLGFYSLPALK